jgi:hypothetical protein
MFEVSGSAESTLTRTHKQEFNDTIVGTLGRKGFENGVYELTPS